VKFRPGTDDGDYNIKLRNLIKFLEDGDKTKITLRFRGREMAHQEFGMRVLERLKVDLEPHGQIEQFPKMEGRQMVMVLGPKKKEMKPAGKVKKEPAPVVVNGSEAA
jgi:translation initiation factor IF-3